MLDLMRRQAGDDIIAVGEEQSGQANNQRREGRGQEPGSWGIVGSFIFALFGQPMSTSLCETGPARRETLGDGNLELWKKETGIFRSHGSGNSYEMKVPVWHWSVAPALLLLPFFLPFFATLLYFMHV
jgi:hypothetical protein